MEEKISVLIPVYNRERYIRSCIDSILSQTWKNIQVIVYDDGSTDSTVSMVRDYPGIKLIEGKCNKGVSYARNQLLKACDTRYAAWQDSDDTAAPSRIEAQYKMIRETGRAMVFCDCVYMHKRARSVPGDNIRCMGGLLFDMEKVREIYFNEQVTLGAEDTPWISQVNKVNGEPAHLPSQLYYIRIHPDRISAWKRKPGNIIARQLSDNAYNEEMRRLNG